MVDLWQRLDLVDFGIELVILSFCRVLASLWKRKHGVLVTFLVWILLGRACLHPLSEVPGL